MAEKKLKELTKRHFTEAEKMNLYIVCFGCNDHCILTKEEVDYIADKLDGEECTKHFTRLWSPLPKDDFTKLAKAKIDDNQFWLTSILRDIVQGRAYGYSGI